MKLEGHSRKLTWQVKITIFNRRYIFIHGCFSIVMLVFRGCIAKYLQKFRGFIDTTIDYKYPIIQILVWFCFFVCVVFLLYHWFWKCKCLTFFSHKHPKWQASKMIRQTRQVSYLVSGGNFSVNSVSSWEKNHEGWKRFPHKSINAHNSQSAFRNRVPLGTHSRFRPDMIEGKIIIPKFVYTFECRI